MYNQLRWFRLNEVRGSMSSSAVDQRGYHLADSKAMGLDKTNSAYLARFHWDLWAEM